MSENVTHFPNFPRAVRPAPEPLALYLRLGRNDHREMLNLIASGDVACFGAVFDPCQLARHGELKDQVLAHRLDAILDPKTQQSALPGGQTSALGTLPWGIADRPHQISDFQDTKGRRLIAALGDFVLEQGFTQVIAPTHVLAGADDPWLAVDAESTRRLRNHLNRGNGASVPIIYSLAIPYAVFRDREQRRALIETLKTVSATALWLKIDGFGATCSPTAARTYIQSAAEFHELGVPVIADHVGGVIGLAVMAFGAAGGIAHGVTLGERFDASSWRKPRKGGGFGPQRRVYVPAIDALLKPKEAEALISSSGRARGLFGCTDTRCCPRGIKDMLENPGRHFLYQRMKEIGGLSQVPEQLRPQRFLDTHLRPATDKALAAATIHWEDDVMAKKMQENRKRLDALRVALGHHAERMPPQSFANLPKTRAAREIRR
jgi:hypothetical protein